MKYFSIILFTCLISNLGFSQDTRFGFTASPTINFSNISQMNNGNNNSFTGESSSKTGFAYGILLDKDFNGDDRYFLHSGITLHHSGYEYEETVGMGPNSGTRFTNEVNVSYLEIPLVLKLKTNEFGYLRYYGQFGLNNGIKVSQKIKQPSNSQENSFNDFNTFNIGLNVGGGVEYSISPETSAVGGLFFNNGFTNGIDNGAGEIKQNQLGLRLGIYF